MTDLGKGLRILARDALGSSKKRRHISSFLKNCGFISLGKGSWLGFRNEDIVSGFIIEGSPLDTYISTFILPSFDRHTFVSWSLGNRVVHCSLDGDTREECRQAVSCYVADISKVKSSADLIGYLDARQVKGHYSIWARYICYLKLLDFDAAVSYLDESKRSQLHSVQLEKFEEINRFAVARDKDGVFSVLEGWSIFSQRIFGPFDQTFRAFSDHSGSYPYAVK